MKSSILKKLVPHLIAIGIFLVIAIVYCSPALQGKVVNQHDVLGWKGMAQQSFEYKEKYGRFPLWTNSMFSGMPAYNIAIDQDYPVNLNLVYYVLTLGLPDPISYFFVACLCFYCLCLVLRIRYLLAIMAAIAFAYSTYDPIIIAVGHNTKMQCLALAPATIAGFLLLLQRKYLWGLTVLTIFFGIQMGTQHLQIVYYTLIALAFVGLCYLINSWKQAELKKAFLPLALAVVAGALGFFTYAVSLLPVQDYAKETMRGGRSELTQPNDPENKSKGGLDREYAFRWSYGVGETVTLLVPDSYGGSDGGSGKHYTAPTKFTEKFTEAGVPEENAAQLENAYSYWGDQPGTSGPVYLGAIMCFLFIFGLVYAKGWNKWWMISISVVGILMAWGKNFSSLNYFLFDYLPFYNKFRAPSMGMVLPQLGFPLLGALALEQLLSTQSSREETWKKFRLSVLITAGVFVIAAFMYFSSDYRGRNDTALRDSWSAQMSQGNPNPQMQQQAQSFAQSAIRALQDDRKSLFRGDLIRSFFLVALAVVLMGLYIRNKLKAMPLMIGLLVLSSFDVLAIGRRYLNDEKYVEKDEFENSIQPTQADRQIMTDQNKPFRVYDQTEQITESSRASYFHNSIGGYHPAKLALYNDLIEHQLSKGNIEVFNMLNTRYFIMMDPTGRQAVARVNPGAFGPAWFVKGIKYVQNADAEMLALDSTKLRDTAIIQLKYKAQVKWDPKFDSTASVRVLEYMNDRIKYEMNVPGNQLVVFSEIFYPRGWNAFLDGVKTDYLKVDYLLRGMFIPTGKHQVEFKFEPRSYHLGNLLTLIASLLAYALLAIAIFMEIRKNRKSG